MKQIDKAKLITRIISDHGFNGLSNLIKYQLDLSKQPNEICANPISIQLELTTCCNLRCKMCEHALGQVDKKMLDFVHFKEILDQFPYLKNLTLQGLGEPLLNPDLFLMIAEAKKRGIRIGFTTNATLLKEPLSAKLVNSGLDWMYISIDSVDKTIYEQIRNGAIFEEVRDNIINFMRLKGDGQPDTNFWILIMKSNINQIPDVVKFAEEIGIKRAVLQNLHNWGYANFSDSISGIKNTSSTDLSSLIEGIKAQKSVVKVEINTIKNSGKKCDWPWRSLYVTCDGFVAPCCMQGCDPRVINFGNLSTEPVKEIINNPAYQKFRSDLKDGMPKVCRGCPGYFEQEVIRI
ncbi:radical SAM protein [Patescibacteria group bacterium]|nr:radical SAM protein [Patescibacteria group bacterium]